MVLCQSAMWQLHMWTCVLKCWRLMWIHRNLTCLILQVFVGCSFQVTWSSGRWILPPRLGSFCLQAGGSIKISTIIHQFMIMMVVSRQKMPNPRKNLKVKLKGFGLGQGPRRYNGFYRFHLLPATLLEFAGGPRSKRQRRAMTWKRVSTTWTTLSDIRSTAPLL